MQADRKMEPWMLRDLAQIARDHTWGKDTDWTRHLDGEAARREAEAKPKRNCALTFSGCCSPVECEQAGHCIQRELRGGKELGRAPAGARNAEPAGANPNGEREGPDSAAAAMPFNPDMLMRWEMRPVGSDETRREHRLEVTGFTLADVRQKDERIDELLRECGQWQEASGQANVRAEKLEDRLDARDRDVAELVAAATPKLSEKARQTLADFIEATEAMASEDEDLATCEAVKFLLDYHDKTHAAIAKHKGGA